MLPYHEKDAEKPFRDDSNGQQPDRTSIVRRRPVTRLLQAFALITITCLLVRSFVHIDAVRSTASDYGGYFDTPVPEELVPLANRVPLEAHIMSKCPDARDCLRDLIIPTMERVGNMVDFRLSYIGTTDNKTDGVSCKHGPSECLGNIILLCAAREYPSPVMSLGFANCMISDYKDIPSRELVQNCALEHGLSFDKVNACVSEEGEGVGLLRDSIQRSAAAGVQKSCTVRLGNEFRCIRDGGEWTDCEDGSRPKDLIADIEKLYKQQN